MRRENLSLFLLRLFLGAWFLWAGIPKLKYSYAHEEIGGMLNYFAVNGSVSFYQSILYWMANHAVLFGYLTSWGEVITGVALILGLFTPLACLAVIAMCFNYFLATFKLGPASMGLNLLCIVTAIALMVGGAGRYLGIDAFRTKR